VEQNGDLMSIADAQRRLAGRPRLRRVISKSWLTEQAALIANQFHPLYGLLEWGIAASGIEAFLDGLERTLAAPIGGSVAERARRLTEGEPPHYSDYWAALDELSIATHLSDCGLAVRFGNSAAGELDLVVRAAGEELRMELTAPERTRELEALQLQITAGWTLPLVAHLLIGRVTYRPTRRERDLITARVRETASTLPTTLSAVDLGGLVDPGLLRVSIEPSTTAGYVESSSGDILGHYDPVPDIEDAIARKRRQLRRHTAVIMAVNINAINPDPYSWGLRSIIGAAYGTPVPSITCAANVVGAIAFLRGVPGSPPVMPLWLTNQAWAPPEPRPLAPVLACLGARR
jgi:hypothetical protein